jgi:hypothetical protein
MHVVQTYIAQSYQHQQYHGKRDQNGRTIEWCLPHDHFEADI